MKRILIIDTSDVGATYTAEAVISLGYEPVFLINLNDFQGDTITQVKRYRHFHSNTKSLQDLLVVIKQEYLDNIAGVFTALDSKIPVAVALAQALGVRGLSAALITLSNKNQVTSMIPDYCPVSLLLRKDAIDDCEEIITSTLSHCEQLILKPCNAAGGLGVKVLSYPVNKTEIDHHINAFNYDEWQLMDFIQGDLVSLEGFVADGVCHFLGFTSRNKVGHTESYFSFPFDKSLPQTVIDRAQQAIQTLVHTAAFSNGYFHSEFMVNNHQCFLIDANFGRIGGGPIIEVIAYSYSISAVDIMKHIIGLSLFPELKTDDCLYKLLPKRKAAGVNYGVSQQCIFYSVHASIPMNDIRHIRLVNEGMHVPEMGVNNWSWVGLVSGPAQRVDEFMTHLQIRTNQGVLPPCY